MTAYYEERFGGNEVLDAPRPGAWRDPRFRRSVLVAALVAVALAVGGEYLLVAPASAERDETAAAAAKLAAYNRESEATLAGYEAFLARKADTDRRFEEATAAVPTKAELASVLDSIRTLAAGSRMRLVSFTPSAPSAPATGDALYRCSSTVVVRGGYADLQSLLASLGEYPRMLTVESMSIATSAEPGYALDATIGLTCYYKAAPSRAN